MTGWILLRTFDASTVRKSGKHMGHRAIGPAMVSLWRRAATVLVAICLNGDAYEHDRWITGTGQPYQPKPPSQENC